MTDRIRLQELAFYGYHGIKVEEKSLGQRFFVDLELGLDLAPAGRADDLSLTLDYGEAYRVVRELVEGTSFDLLETVAERVAGALLERFGRLEWVTVCIKKPAAPIAGAHFGTIAVEISRARDGSRPG